jgi:MoaA/NifB/PqqE/SkfB family radical SAM enzyme
MKLTWQRVSEAVNSRLGYIARGRLGSLCRPSGALFLLTERCNARCVHCDIWKNKGGEASPGLEGWSKVLRDLRSWMGPKPLAFTGGEALLRPYTLELVHQAISLGFPLEVLTHGYWRDQTKIQKLAEANPWRITMSLDGIGETHSKIRGREAFFERSNQTVETLLRVREENKLNFILRLKTVVMEHNLHDVGAIAEYATRPGVEVFYQPIEQNYNTPEDPAWFESSQNWPRDPERAVAAVEELMRLKKAGLHIANSERQLAVMAPYFREPAALRVATQSHVAQRRRPLCAALTLLQFQSNGDVTVCCNRAPVGNVKEQSIRQIWAQRPHYWESGCCLTAPPGAVVSQKPGMSLPIFQTHQASEELLSDDAEA